MNEVMDIYDTFLESIDADLAAGKIDQEQADFLREWLDLTVKMSYEKLRERYKPEDFIDVTGTVLTPSWHGQECQGNGEHLGVECCCDECDFLMICIPDGEENNTFSL